MIPRKYSALLLLYLFWTMTVASILLVEDHHSVTVTEVVDGDTLRVIYEGKEEQIRLDGIDTSECWANPKAERDSQRCGKDLKTLIQWM